VDYSTFLAMIQVLIYFAGQPPTVERRRLRSSVANGVHRKRSGDSNEIAWRTSTVFRASSYSATGSPNRFVHVNVGGNQSLGLVSVFLAADDLFWLGVHPCFTRLCSSLFSLPLHN